MLLEMLRLTRSTGYLKRCLFGNGSTCVWFCDQSRIKPSLSSLSLSVDDDKYFNFNIPGLGKTETDENLSLFSKMPGVKKEHVKACADPKGSLLLIRGKKYEESYYGGKLPKVIYLSLTGLPENVHMNNCMIKTEMLQDGMFETTLPKLKDQQLKKTNFFTNIFYSRFNFILGFYSSIPSVIMTITRSFVIDLFCTHPLESFTMYKKETAKSLHISVATGLYKKDAITGDVCVSLNMPELRIDNFVHLRKNKNKIEQAARIYNKDAFTGDVCVHLNMPELRIEDVNLSFTYGTLFIQGKTKTKTSKVQYITGIRLPEFTARSRSLIKEEMQDGMYKATIPFTPY